MSPRTQERRARNRALPDLLSTPPPVLDTNLSPRLESPRLPSEVEDLLDPESPEEQEEYDETGDLSVERQLLREEEELEMLGNPAARSVGIQVNLSSSTRTVSCQTGPSRRS